MGEHSNSALGTFLRSFQSAITEVSDFTPDPTTSDTAISVADAVTMLEENLYEVYKPENAEPEADIVFFHGLYIGDCKDAHVTTWMSSSDPPEFWIQTWLPEIFPRARILTVSYDASTWRGDQEGRSDLFLIAESLLYALAFRNEVGQSRSRPVILVGHSVGTLLIKQLCVMAHRPWTDAKDREKARKFVNNLRGVFLFAPPNLGMNLNEMDSHLPKLNRVVKGLKLLNTSTARLNEEFRKYCEQYNWIVAGVGESQLTQRTIFSGRQTENTEAAFVVSEASSRSGMDRFHQVAADHFSICKPKDRSSSAYQALLDNIERMLTSKLAEETFAQIALPQHVVGLDVHIDEILHKIENAQRVGIYGMGGVGKTTLAKAVFNRIGPHFQYYCFVEARDEAKRGLKKLQKRILKSLRDSSAVQGQDTETSVPSWESFEGQRVLIVLDDVDDSEQLSDTVLPDMSCFRNGSKLIATSRDSRFFKNYDSYELRELDPETSHQLFCSHAFQDIPVPAHLEQYLLDVVKKCNGLPLAIEVIGSYLYGKDNDDLWKEVVDKLARAEEPSGSREGRHNLWSTLQISYDALESSERQMFLDLATVFYGEPLHIIKASWSTSWGSAESGLDNLVSKCLVRIVEIDPEPRKRRPFHPHRAAFEAPDTKFTVWIHEQLRDLGQSLVTRPAPSRDLVSLDKRSRVWRQEDAETLLTESYEKHPQETIGLVFKGFNPKDSALSASLVNLKQLKFLLFEPSVNDVKLPPTLCLLRSNMFSGHPSSTLQQLTNLAVLELYACNEPDAVLRCIGNLTQLRVLTIRRSCTFKYTNDPTLLPPHEEFNIWPHSKSAVLRLPDEIGQLASLQYLTLDVDGFTELPASFARLSRLTYCLLRCESLVRLPEEFGWLTSLTELILLYCESLATLPISFGKLPKLERLTAYRCLSLTELPESVGKLSTLKTLNSCLSFHTFPETFGNLSGLQSLLCDVKEIPQEFGNLAALEELVCSNLNFLPESFGSLQSLKQMTVEMSSIRELPDSFCSLSKLEKLSFYYCLEMSSLPKKFGQLQSLKFLRFRECRRLETLPESFGDLVALEKLHFYGCPKVSMLPDSFGRLRSLRELYFRDCSIKTLPIDFGQLVALEKLQFERCEQLEVLPERFGPLDSLRRLDFMYCPIRNIPFSSEDLNRVEKVKISYCYRLETPLESFGRLLSLKRLDIHCCSIKAGSRSFEGLDKLEQLKLVSCSELSELPDNFDQFRSLKHLEITNCPIEVLPGSFGYLAALRILLITNCKNLTRLPDTIGNLKTLARLRLDQCPIEALPETFGGLSSLKELIIENCTKLMTLPDSFGRLYSLQQFGLGKSPVEALPDVFRELRSLADLYLIECKRLTFLPESLREPRTLIQQFKIHTYDCPLQDLGGGLFRIEILTYPREYLKRRVEIDDDDP